jgi:hypothetical protein
MLHHYLHHPVDWDILKTPPTSAAKALIKTESLEPEDEWWQEVLSDSAKWQSSRTCDDLVESYVAWFDKFQGRGTKKKNSKGLGIYFKRHFGRGGMRDWPKLTKTGPREQRVNAWMFPELSKCREVFDRATGTQTTWEEADTI